MSLLDCLIWDISLLLPSDWDLNYTFISLASQTFGFGLELHHQLSWVAACRWQIMKLLSLHNHVGQFFTINLILVLFPWRTLKIHWIHNVDTSSSQKPYMAIIF